MIGTKLALTPIGGEDQRRIQLTGPFSNGWLGVLQAPDLYSSILCSHYPNLLTCFATVAADN
jgi:hypothetical protein